MQRGILAKEFVLMTSDYTKENTKNEQSTF